MKIDGISLDGFSEATEIGALWKTRCWTVPRDCGVYLIIRDSESTPEFLPESTGGRFKKREPTCVAQFVRDNWIEGARVVYVGKASGRKGLNRRLYDLVSFGYGQPIGHWGGRLLWHLPEKEKLLVRWRICRAEDADAAETIAIGDFKSMYGGRRPYANLMK